MAECLIAVATSRKTVGGTAKYHSLLAASEASCWASH